MLKAVGIIAEYNPFHNGHLYQIREARKLTHADIVVVVMSGNWVQRGQPALIDKWQRTKMALQNGADLVLELPVQSVVQPAHIFAQHAVNILTQIGCSFLSFGSENPTLDFDLLASKISQNESTNDGIFNNHHLTYSALIQAQISAITGYDINQPNDILGLNYAIANYQNNSKLTLFPIPRQASSHHDTEIALHSHFASGSALRQLIMQSDLSTVLQYMPQYSAEVFNHIVTWNQLWPLLKYKLITTSVDELATIYQMTEGLQYRLKKYVSQAQSFNEFLHLIKTKRYTYARLRRLLVYTLLNWQDSDVYLNQEYIRILGFNTKGQQYLKQVKHTLSVPVITKINKKLAEKELSLEVIAGQIYGNIHGNNQDFGKSPIIY
jgi:cytidyltransferase-like protein